MWVLLKPSTCPDVAPMLLRTRFVAPRTCEQPVRLAFKPDE